MSTRIPDLNNVQIAGRLARDPEMKYTSSNRPYCKVCVVYSKKYNTQSGEKKEESLFIEATFWDKGAEWVAKLAKGRAVVLEGKLRQDEWEDRETGSKRTKLVVSGTRLLPLDWDDSQDGGDRGQAAPARQAPPAAAPPRQARPQPAQAEIPEDDIPF